MVTTRICASEDCGKEFIVRMPHAKYCSERCRSREYKRRVYKERKENGLCPQCGGEMDTGSSASYCKKCQAYFHDNYYKGPTKEASQ